METITRSHSGRAETVAEYVQDRIQAAEADRKRQIEANRAATTDRVDVTELVGLDTSKLAEWREEARAAHDLAVESLKAQARHWQGEEVPAHKPIFPLDRRPDKASLPLCLSTPTDIRFSDNDIQGTGDLATASLEFEHQSSGVGGSLGLRASPYVPPRTASFWYGFDPPAGRSLVVLGGLSFQGYVIVSKFTSSPFIKFLLKYPSLTPGIYAKARIEMFIRVHQNGTFGPQTVRLPMYEFDNPGPWEEGLTIRLLLPKVFATVMTAQIVADEPVAIELGVEFDAIGHSDFCTAEIGTAQVSSSEHGTVAKALCLNLLPPEVIL